MRHRSESHPEFISIGSARCGSTWLAERLRRHPDVWIPPIKEIHYFDMQRVLPCWHWIRLRRYTIHFRRYVAYLLRRDAGRSKSMWHDFRWGLRYFFAPRSDAWYRRILAPPDGCISGEVTPAYCMLDDPTFQEIAEYFPTTKFLFAMRDPVDRDWSQTVMHLNLHRRRGSPSDHLLEIEEVISRDEVIRRSSYLDVLRKLDRLPQDRVHIYFFDQVRDAPVETLRDICGFLGINQDENVLDETSQQKVAARDMANRSMPPAIELMLANRWLPMIHELADRFGEIPARWEERAKRVIAGAAS